MFCGGRLKLNQPPMMGMSPNAPSQIVPIRGTYQRHPVIVVWLLKLLSANKSQVFMYTLDLTMLVEIRDSGLNLRSLGGVPESVSVFVFDSFLEAGSAIVRSTSTVAWA